MHALHGMWDPCICSVSIELAGGGALAGRCRTAAPDRRGPACRRAPRSGVNAAAPRVSVVPLALPRAQRMQANRTMCARATASGMAFASPHTVTYVYSNGRPVQQRALSRSTARRQRRNVTCPTALPWACGMPACHACRRADCNHMISIE